MQAMTRAAVQDLASVVASAAAGDDIAFARIVAAYHEDMRRVCPFVTRDEALADEAVQAAWSTIWRKARLGTAARAPPPVAREHRRCRFQEPPDELKRTRRFERGTAATSMAAADPIARIGLARRSA